MDLSLVFASFASFADGSLSHRVGADMAFCDHGPMTVPDRDTIAAIATAPGAGGIGIVRLSGVRSC